MKAAIPEDYKFIADYDDTARLINKNANRLYQQLKTLDITKTEVDEFGKYYFSRHHAGRRLVFSIESSAAIIYHSVKLYSRKLNETVFLDYGAGLGTLFLLAGMMGFKKIYYNDYFPAWAANAKIVCKKLEIDIDDFIVGDIDAVLDYGKANNISFDIVASRNVVEHIYDLRGFYEKLYQSHLTTICYSTTTANYHNVAMRLKHYWYHNKVEKATFKKQRQDYIKELVPGINATDLDALTKLTRGKAFADFTNAVTLYFDKKPIPAVEFLRTNTCDCRTGVWAENMITRQNYFSIIEKAGFQASFTAGFWDTHYKYKALNVFTGFLNRIIKIISNKGYWLSPFTNVIAVKKQS